MIHRLHLTAIAASRVWRPERYRNGYDKPLVWMEKGKVAKVTLQPLTTGNYFEPGHRLRIEISSSNFSRFDRNLNTGGKNYDEATGVVAHNGAHRDGVPLNRSSIMEASP